MPHEKPIIIWFRNDLRLSDHPALFAAKNRPVIPLYIHSQSEEDIPMGEASSVWLHHSLAALDRNLKQKGSSLVLRKGDSLAILREIIAKTGADTVYWIRRYEPKVRHRDERIKAEFIKDGIVTEDFPGLLFEPWIIATKENKPFQVFAPFWKRCQKMEVREVLNMPALVPWKQVLSSQDLELLPKVRWDRKIMDHWTPGEEGARNLIKAFDPGNYDHARDYPSFEGGTSHLSPHLHFGEISPFQLWHCYANEESFLRQIAWREFAHHLLYHFPYIIHETFKKKFDQFVWENNPVHLERWQKGLTGYPIVDAGMRQLWQTGWMHNRVRMIVGSFLVKDLLIDWKEGAAWFWNTLVDADLANNTFGWQWVGGMGADAAPFFRIFNPILQGEKFDEEGAYVKKYLPELSLLSQKWIHRPFEAPEAELKKAGISLGKDYPYPIVNHSLARACALKKYKSQMSI